MKKQITFFCHCFYPSKGGVEQVAKTFYDILEKEYNVQVFTGQGENLDSYKTFKTLVHKKGTETIHRVPLKRFWQKLYNKVLNKVIFVAPYFSQWYFGPILDYSDADLAVIEQSDIIVGFAMPTKTFTDAAYFAKKYNKQLVLLPAYHNVSYFNNSSPFQDTLTTANSILVLSQKEEKELKNHYSLQKGATTLLNYGYFTEKEIAAQEHKAQIVERKRVVIGVVGQIVERKNLSFYKEVIQELSSRSANYEFYFAGARTNSSTRVEQSLKPYVDKELQIEYDVKDVKKAYEKLSIILNPSIEESFGIANFEGMFYGKPVLVHAQSPMADIYKKENLDTTFHSEKEAVRLIEKLMENPHYNKQVIVKQYTLLKRYSLNALEKQIIEVFASIPGTTT